MQLSQSRRICHLRLNLDECKKVESRINFPRLYLNVNVHLAPMDLMEADMEVYTLREVSLGTACECSTWTDCFPSSQVLSTSSVALFSMLLLLLDRTLLEGETTNDLHIIVSLISSLPSNTADAFPLYSSHTLYTPS